MRKCSTVMVLFPFRQVLFREVKIIEYLSIYLIAKDGVCIQGIECENRRCFCLDWRLYYENTGGKYILYRYLLCFEYEVIISVCCESRRLRKDKKPKEFISVCTCDNNGTYGKCKYGTKITNGPRVQMQTAGSKKKKIGLRFPKNSWQK